MWGRKGIILGRSSKRIFLRLCLLTASIISSFVLFALTHRRNGLAAAQPQVKTLQKQQSTGSWTTPLETDVIAIHAAMLPTGQVLMWFSDQPFNSSTGSRAELWNPVTNALTPVQLPYTYDIFCAGESLLQDGRIFVTGGRDDSKNGDYGIPEATLFNPANNEWSEVAPMNYARWYPTNVELQDGTTLVFSGDDDNQKLVLPVESYNYQTGAWTVLPATANIAKAAYVYPRMVLLPSGHVFMGGMTAPTSLFDPATNTWSRVGNMNFGARYYGGMILLPGLEQVLTAGGDPQQNQGGTATNTAEIIDFTQPTPAWQYVAPMNVARQNENLVLLPDGTVLAVGGGGGGGRYSNPVFQAEDYNPTSNTWTLLTAQEIQRTYHSTALLLPDGRVFSAGSDNGDVYNSRTVEVFSPPYLQNGTRPTITSAPSELTYGEQFTIVTPDASSIMQVALIKVESNTHATRFDARFVDLSFTPGQGQITATAPASGNDAPPGYYYLDILNSSGVPAIMPFVLVTTTAVPIVNASPAGIVFGGQTVGTASAPQSITLTNTGTVALSISSITTGADFSETNSCATSVAAGANCTISVTFNPASAGTLNEPLTITDNAYPNPQTWNLSGTGSNSVVTFSPASLTFTSQQAGTSSPPQNVTLNNTGAMAVSITAITSSSSFSQTNTCGTSVAGGTNCTIAVTFTPKVSGSSKGTLSVTDNASGSPQTVPLSGTGTTPTAGLSPTSLSFGSQTVGTVSAPQTVTLSNNGLAPLAITSINLMGTNAGDFAETNTCGSSVAAGASCTFSVTFIPLATGARSASISITDNARGSPQVVALSGTGM